MNLPRAILFDLDDTIISFGRRRLQLQEIAERWADHWGPFSPAEAADRLERQFEIFWGDAERHKVWRQQPLAEARRFTTREAFGQLRAEGAAALNDELAHAFADEFNAHREASACLFPRAVETLEEIRRRGVLMALVTNGSSQVQREKIVRYDLARHFDHIQIEGEHGFGKPEERAYSHALEALDVAAAETWMVGDNLEWEVAAPQRLGIFGVWHDHLGDGLPPGSPVRPDRIIQCLSELLEE